MTKIKLQDNQALEAKKSAPQRHLWPMGSAGVVGTMVGSAALLFALASNPAHALGLGRLTVQSALGEALRAEIEVPEITAEEAVSLRVRVASADAFKAAGLEYSAAVADVQISLQRRPDGRYFLRLSSQRPVTEPFVDFVLDASWGSGRVVRDYAMLFDPPNLRQSAQAIPQPTAPSVSRPAAPVIASPAKPPFVSSTPAPAPLPTTPALAPVKPVPVAKARALAPAAKPRPAASVSVSPKVAVNSGDTAGGIALQNKPSGISLDQMLVALLRSNPNAFIGGNVNRLKAGAVLDIPSAEQAGSVTSSEATSTIVAQAKDFNDFRRKLAAGAPITQVDAATRKAGGNVQAKVEDRAAVAATPDRLTLSKGTVQGKAPAEEKIAKDKQAKDAESRVAELSKNIEDLNKIAGITSAPPSPAPAATSANSSKPPVIPGVQVPTGPAIVPAVPVSATTTTPAISSASVAVVAPTATAVLTPATPTAPAAATTTAPAVSNPSLAPASAPVAVKKPVVIPPPALPEPSLIDQLTDNPLVLPGLGLLLALLAGFGFYRYKKRNQQQSVDSSFLESRLQPDSFFGASGGQRIDTTNSGDGSGSSLVYSASQLDAAGDVDPVAEADVYLAYGRDLQAEEILKEAMRTHPTRVAIHAKLMEIYAKRRDIKGFESIAGEAYVLTSGKGPEWAYICELGRDLDPGNPTYLPGGQPTSGHGSLGHVVSETSSVSDSATAAQIPASAPASVVDFDLDLDFSDEDGPTQSAALEPKLVTSFAPVPVPAPVSAGSLAPAPSYTPEPTAPVQAKDEPAVDVLDLNFGDEPSVGVKTPARPQPIDNSPTFNLDPLPVVAQADASPAKAAVAEPVSGMLDFDMSSLSLDLNAPSAESPAIRTASVAAAPAESQGPLEIKLSLAEEFHALGDSDGARSLANEVVAQADGALKSKAQAFLNALS